MMHSELKRSSQLDRKIFLVIIFISFTIFLFSSDGHRFTIDEDTPQQQSKRILTQTPHPDYIQNESRVFFELPNIQKTNSPICYNGVLCSTSQIGHSVIELPFIFLNNQFHIISENTLVLTSEDFIDQHYVWWRNSIDPDLTFMELFFGPTLFSITIGIFFLVCRTYNFERKNCISLSFMLAFGTIIWAYSQTSLNVVPNTFLLLLGFFCFRKFQLTENSRYLLFCGLVLGFGFLVRNDAIFLISITFFYLLYLLMHQKQKILKFFSYVSPLIGSYIIFRIITIIRFTPPENSASKLSKTISSIPDAGSFSYPLHQGVFGLLFSPGVGLFIFSPILLTAFFSFLDFYKKHKTDCIFLLSFISTVIIYYGSQVFWHGLQSWGPRYLLILIPFLLLPLAASMENRNNKYLKIILIILVGLGMFFNLSYIVQDVSWFVWGLPYQGGLFALHISDERLSPLTIDAVTVWTFQYSQLTHAISLAFTSLQPDVFLFRLLGTELSFLILAVIVVPLSLYILKLLKTKSTKSTVDLN